MKTLTVLDRVFVQILCLLVCRSVLVSGGSHLLSNDLDEGSPNHSDQKAQVQRGRRINPARSWSAFIRHSKNDRLRQKRQKGKNKAKYSLHGSPGPQGPAGPPGPRGPPGALITPESLMKEFKKLVKEESEKRAERLVNEKCSTCSYLNNMTVGLFGIDELLLVPRIAIGFHYRLKSNTAVEGKTFLELKNFHKPFGGGTFQRGKSFDPKEGRFTVSKSGIYQFTVSLHIAKKKMRKKRKLRRTDNVRIMICIQSLCQKNTSLESISGLDSNSRLFTVNVQGFLNLEEGQYTSVYVDNSSPLAVSVQSGSIFSAVLIGV